MTSKVKFEIYLRDRGFVKRIHKIENTESVSSVSQYKIIGNHIVICRFLSKMYTLGSDTFEVMRIPKQNDIIDYKMLDDQNIYIRLYDKKVKSNSHVKLDDVIDLNDGCSFYKIISTWVDFKSTLKYILRDTRLNNIIDNKNK